MPDEKMNNSGEELVSLHGASVQRDGRWLIRDVSFSVNRGEIVSLIGPNGSGKSTTAKLIVGVDQPTSGRVDSIEGLTVGYVPQKLHIDWTLPLTVSRLMTLTQSVSTARVVEALEEVGIAHLAASEVQALSGGEFQRALLARAILRNPDILILDEPVQGVDFGGELALYDLIGEIRDRLNCGIMMISHDLHIVMGQTDRVICLNGHVCCSGSPQSVSESAEYRDLFGGRAVDRLAIYHHHHDHSHLPDGTVVHRHEGHEKHEGQASGEHEHVG